MSRQIDVTDASSLSVEDRLYLQHRGQLPEDATPVLETGQQAHNATLGVNTGTVNTVPQYEAEIELGGNFKKYNEMTVQELKRELSDRDLGQAGTKGELIYRLLADDADPDKDDEDEEVIE
jgi:hypothetical protein